MKRFLANARICNAKCVGRVIAFAVAGGTALLYSNNSVYSSDFNFDGCDQYVSRKGFVSFNSSNEGKVAGGSKSLADAAADVFPSLVVIDVPMKKRGKGRGLATGSGTIIDDNGTILTCAHNVTNHDDIKVTSNGRVNVTLQDGRTFVGTISLTDIHYDVALVKIDSNVPLPAAKLGSSCKLRPGDPVFALGCPLLLSNTITAGTVSCVNRKSSDLGRGGMLREYIQHDCATNSGNSGGPLVNLDGEVIGVHVFRRRGANGLHFAVPIDPVLKMMNNFKKNGTVIRLWLGMKMLDLDEMLISQLRYKYPKFPKVTKGVLVVVVEPGSPADVAGICPGDVVTRFHRKSVGSITEIITLMGDEVGKPFNVVVKRATESLSLTVVAEAANPEI